MEEEQEKKEQEQEQGGGEEDVGDVAAGGEADDNDDVEDAIKLKCVCVWGGGGVWRGEWGGWSWGGCREAQRTQEF